MLWSSLIWRFHVWVVDVEQYLYKIICIYLYVYMHGCNGSLFEADNESSLLSGPNIFMTMLSGLNIFMTCYPVPIFATSDFWILLRVIFRYQAWALCGDNFRFSSPWWSGFVCRVSGSPRDAWFAFLTWLHLFFIFYFLFILFLLFTIIIIEFFYEWNKNKMIIMSFYLFIFVKSD